VRFLNDSKDSAGKRKERFCFLIADIAAMILFSTALCMCIEIFIAKLTFFQSVTARIVAIPVNLITGRPYGLFRDRLFLALGIERKKPWKMILGDTLAFVIFQVPLYVIVLLCAGATWKQIAVSSVFMSAVFSLAGRPYGIFLDFCRRVAGNVVRNM
jgi:hypothetical protein